jgi:hypothetical protein
MNSLSRLLIRCLFNPFINLVNIFLSLNSCRVLFNPRTWHKYSHFTDHGILVAPFYWVRILNLIKHGRNGKSNTLGLGGHSMSSFWQYSIPSAIAYWKAGAVTLLISMLVYTLTLFIWFLSINPIQLSLAILILITSEKFYSQLFYRQNYNIIGWAIFPFLLYSLYNNSIALSVLAYGIIPYLSVTVLFLSNIFALFFAIEHQNPYLFIPPAIGSVLFLLHVKSTTPVARFLQSILKRLKMIGFITTKNTKYKRKRKIPFHEAISVILQIQFAIIAYIFHHELYSILIIGIIMHLINICITRFADEQSFSMLYLSCSFFSFITTTEISLILTISYLISLFDMQYRTIPVSPINTQPIIDRIYNFISPIHSNNRILLAYSNPKNSYDKIFDGYRFLIDYLVYCSHMKNIHAMPDFSTIYDANTPDSPDFWGRTPSEVLDNLDQFDANHVIIYQEPGTEIDPQWERHGLKSIGTFDWSVFLESYPFYIHPNYKRPKWFLLERAAT